MNVLSIVILMATFTSSCLLVVVATRWSIAMAAKDPSIWQKVCVWMTPMSLGGLRGPSFLYWRLLPVGLLGAFATMIVAQLLLIWATHIQLQDRHVTIGEDVALDLGYVDGRLASDGSRDDLFNNLAQVTDLHPGKRFVNAFVGGEPPKALLDEDPTETVGPLSILVGTLPEPQTAACTNTEYIAGAMIKLANGRDAAVQQRLVELINAALMPNIVWWPWQSVPPSPQGSALFAGLISETVESDAITMIIGVIDPSIASGRADDEQHLARIAVLQGAVDWTRRRVVPYWRAQQLVCGPIQFITLILGFIAIAALRLRGAYVAREIRAMDEIRSSHQKQLQAHAGHADPGGQAAKAVCEGFNDTTNFAEGVRSTHFVSLWVDILRRSKVAHARKDQGMVAKGLVDAVHDRTNDRLDRVEYALVDWIVWALPSFGFIGTVIGISLAMGEATGIAQASDRAGRITAIEDITSTLGVAFDTTLVALVAAIPVMALMAVYRAREHDAVDAAGEMIDDLVIRRLMQK